MNRRALGVAAVMLVTAFSTSAESQPQGCTLRVGEETYFIGRPRCLAALPQKEISGYWVSGHEYSVFYADKQSVQRNLDVQASWLFLSSEAEGTVKSKVRPGEWQVFAVRFVGAKATMRGVYGPGPFKGGVLVARVLEINEIAP